MFDVIVSKVLLAFIGNHSPFLVNLIDGALPNPMVRLGFALLSLVSSICATLAAVNGWYFIGSSLWLISQFLTLFALFELDKQSIQLKSIINVIDIINVSIVIVGLNKGLPQFHRSWLACATILTCYYINEKLQSLAIYSMDTIPLLIERTELVIFYYLFFILHNSLSIVLYIYVFALVLTALQRLLSIAINPVENTSKPVHSSLDGSSNSFQGVDTEEI
jgi:uncharacterized membrane protein YozB (DUF420 family)